MAIRFVELVNKIAALERVPAAVAQALVDTENSRRDPSIVLQEAWGGGSYGLTMITLRTARSLGFAGPATLLLEPANQLRYGFRYLRKMYDKVGSGSWTRARAAYVAGPDLKPWPDADLARFTRNLARWSRAPDFRKVLIPWAGIGALILALILMRRRRKRWVS